MSTDCDWNPHERRAAERVHELLPGMFKGYEMIPLMHLAITTFGRKELDLVSDGVGLSRSAKFLLGLRGYPHWEESVRASRSQGFQRAPTFSTHGSTGQRSVSK